MRVTRNDLKIYMHDGPTVLRIKLYGCLNNRAVARLQQVRRTAQSSLAGRALILDLTFVNEIDAESATVVRDWTDDGVEIAMDSVESSAMVANILGVAVQSVPRPKHLSWGHAVLPKVLSFVNLAICLAWLFCSQEAVAANLKPETISAWDEYVKSADAKLQNRAGTGGQFMWALETSERSAKIRRGETLVAPAGLSQNPLSVEGGLIHHWIGSTFIPDCDLDHLIDLTRDYDRYKVFYGPSVVDSRTLVRGAQVDQYSLTVINQSVFFSSAFDAEYRSRSVRLDGKRLYSIVDTIKVQEVNNYRRPNEQRLPEGEGSGYLWKMHIISRLEQGDGGVYLENEMIALSREMPGALRFAAGPVIRRVARSSMTTSLQQTAAAARTAVTAKRLESGGGGATTSALTGNDGAGKPAFH